MAGSEMVNLVSSFRVQESVTVQTLECRSCRGAQLNTQTGRAGDRYRGVWFILALGGNFTFWTC